MRTGLKRPYLGRYANADHIGFHKTSYAIFNSNNDLINAPELLAAYQAMAAQEDHALKWMHQSKLARRKARTDCERSKTLSEIDRILHTIETIFSLQRRASARLILDLIGDSITPAHIAETDAQTRTDEIDNILRQLNESDNRLAVQKIRIEPQLAQLARLNARYKRYDADAPREQVENPNISSTATRTETDRALRQILTHTTTLISRNGPNAYFPLIKEFNMLVTRYDALIHERYLIQHAQTDISQCEIAYIKPQRYTGRPIRVIPSITIRRKDPEGIEITVKLVHGCDFTVEYLHNIVPGSATIIITGIDKYTGKTAAMFHIATPTPRPPQ
jgi:hypothetical protein